MDKFMCFSDYAELIFGEKKISRTASEMMGMITGQSPRINDITDTSLGSEIAIGNKSQLF